MLTAQKGRKTSSIFPNFAASIVFVRSGIFHKEMVWEFYLHIATGAHTPILKVFTLYADFTDNDQLGH